MIPVLFDEHETTFTSQGLGALTDAVSCIVTEERNGQYVLEMTYRANGAHAEELKQSRIILAIPSRGTQAQPFRIYDIGKTIGGDITVSAEHISYQLSYIPIMPFIEDSATGAMARLTTNSAEPNPFTFSTDIVSTSTCQRKVPSSARATLGGSDGSLLDVYGGEYEWDRYHVTLHRERGTDKSGTVVLRYGKQLTDLKQEESIADTYTGIVPYYFQDDVTVTLPEKVINTDKAENFPFHRTLPIDLTQSFTDGAPTQAELRTEAVKYLNKAGIGVPKVNLDVSFVDLADTLEYADIAPLEEVNLCDTISVEFSELGISTKAKVIKTVWNVLVDRYDSVEIGDAKSSLAQTIVEINNTIEEQEAKTRTAINQATSWLTNGKGYVKAVKNPDGSWKELLFMDQATTQAATKVLRINENGIGFASGQAGTFDSWEYYQAWTLDGNLSIGGVNNSYGTFHVLDRNGVERGYWDNTDLTLIATDGSSSMINVNAEDDSEGGSFSPDSIGFFAYDDGAMIRGNIGAWGWTVDNDDDGVMAYCDRYGIVHAKGFAIDQQNGATDRTEDICYGLEVEYEESGGKDWVTDVSCGYMTIDIKGGIVVGVS